MMQIFQTMSHLTMVYNMAMLSYEKLFLFSTQYTFIIPTLKIIGNLKGNEEWNQDSMVGVAIKNKTYMCVFNAIISEQLRHSSFIVQIELVNETVLHTYINRRIQFHKFEDGVLWPGNVSISYKGLLVMRFEKINIGNWTEPVTDFKVNMTRSNIPLTWPFYIANRSEIAEEVYLITVKPVKKMWYFIEVGYHINVVQIYEDKHQEDLRKRCKKFFDQPHYHYKLCKKMFSTKTPNTGVVRIPHQYTPVPRFPIQSLEVPNPAPHTWHSMNLEIDFFAKSEPKSSFGGRLVSAPLGKVIGVTAPYGTACTLQFDNLGTLFILASGTGISAVLYIIMYMLQMTSVQAITMLYFNRHERNIIFKDGLASLMVVEKRFTVVHILKEPSEEWRGVRGNLSLETVSRYIPPYNSSGIEKDYYAAVCGYKEFNYYAIRYLEFDLKFPDYHIYSFRNR